MQIKVVTCADGGRFSMVCDLKDEIPACICTVHILWTVKCSADNGVFLLGNA